MASFELYLVICAALLALSCPSGDCAGFPLHDAADRLDLKAVKNLIEKKKVNVNSRDDKRQTALHIAMQATTVFWHPYSDEQYNVIKYLLSKRANPNIAFPDYSGLKKYTPVHYAAYDGNMMLLPLMVAAKANVNIRDDRGFTPLHSAARCDFRLSCDDCKSGWKAGAKPSIAYLVSKGADILAKSNAGETVLDILPPNCPQSRKYVQAKMAAAKKKRG